jgi:hypothetical protein
MGTSLEKTSGGTCWFIHFLHLEVFQIIVRNLEADFEDKGLSVLIISGRRVCIRFAKGDP